MSYTKVNWEDAPSTATPLNAENLNHMDDGIDALNNAIAQLTNTVQALQDFADLLEARMDTFVTLPEGATTSDAEVADARNIGDGNTYATLGDAVRQLYFLASHDEVIIEE